MATIQNRPFSKDYSGLINQSVVAGLILCIAISSHEYMRRKRRGAGPHSDELGSVESWEFGYLYQGRSWAKRPSPPLPRGRHPLTWVKQVLTFPEDRINELRGVDAALYVRFLRGSFWWVFLQSFTTFPVLLPIHVTFSDGNVFSSKSMTRASISSLVTTEKGLSLLWVHMILLVWITSTWFATLYWICWGAFRFRAQNILTAASHAASQLSAEHRAQHDPHPHPQYPFNCLPPLDDDHTTRGLRLRTVMVTNIPQALRSEKDVKEYFQYYLSRRVVLPRLGIISSTKPGFLNKTFAFLVNRIRRIPAQMTRTPTRTDDGGSADGTSPPREPDPEICTPPGIDRVVLVRKVNDLASLLERREEILRLLETAHIKLARKALSSVEASLQQQRAGMLRTVVRRMSVVAKRVSIGGPIDADAITQTEGEDEDEGEDRTQLLIRTLKPFLPSLHSDLSSEKHSGWRDHFDHTHTEAKSPTTEGSDDAGARTVWDALLSLPRSALDEFQPLIHLSSIFRGKTVPAIDYYTAKLQIVTSMITEKRSMPLSDYEPMSTAFVSFVDPEDARKACKYLAAHPENPLSCYVTMAPSYEDLDWTRLMKPTFGVEFVKDWVVELGVWAFTLFWVFPVSLFIGLVNIQNLSTLWPGLLKFLQTHAWEEELLQSFLPTILFALLCLLIPLLLLLIAKRAHTIATLSTLHDRIMTRYYKFLIINLLVFFCVGTVALQSFLLSFKSIATEKVLGVIAQSFPIAAPFYVGWLIFTMAMHGGLELALFGLPLILYPKTRRQVTPRKRAMGIRPRTFNYYYWLPNHVLILHVLFVFSLLNPLVIPFATIYFAVERTVVKNQLIHVYAKSYEGNGQNILIRMVRYSLDGLTLAQVVFLAYMVVNEKTVNVALSGVVIVITVLYKLFLTRICRARFERDDVLEAQVVCGTGEATEELIDDAGSVNRGLQQEDLEATLSADSSSDVWPWRLPMRLSFSYAGVASRPRRGPRYRPNPFAPARRSDSTVPLNTPQVNDEAFNFNRPALETWRENIVNTDVRSESPVDTHPAVVSKHPPHRPWEDESSFCHTYDNPYYTRDLDNYLWLPRDPLGILNLDDTIDLRMSLTTQPGAGRLRTWGEQDFIDSIPFATSFASMEDEPASTRRSLYQRVDGTERIQLPPAIASRVSSIGNVDEIESSAALRPSSRRRSSSRSTKAHVGIGRPSMFDGPSGARSLSLGSTSVVSSRGQSTSLILPSGTRRQNRAASMDQYFGSRRPIPLMTTAAARSALSVGDPSTVPNTDISVYSSSTPQGSKVLSVEEAVYIAAIEEEADAAEEREQKEAEETQQPKSWLTSWMFKNSNLT